MCVSVTHTHTHTHARTYGQGEIMHPLDALRRDALTMQALASRINRGSLRYT